MTARNFIFPRLLLAVFLNTALAVFSVAAQPPKPWPEKAFEPLTEERIAALPEGEQPAWREYLERSRKIAASLPKKRVAEVSPAVAPAKSTGARHSRPLKHDAVAEFYATEETRALADRVVVWQSAAGGWTKGIDYAAAPAASRSSGDSWSAGTFDNNATVSELRFLARAISAAPADDMRAEAWRAAFLRGLQYVFDAQYPNGGYPQIYPLAEGYHDAITYNDNAMGRVLEFLADIAESRPGFAFVPAEQRAEAQRRFALGIACVLKTQIVEPSGRRTVWGQQHDMLTLKPCAARKFEPISASAAESASIIRLLMKRTPVTAEKLVAIEAAVAWFEKVALRDAVWDRSTLPASPSRLVEQKGAPLLWARMYELETDLPVFGDRDELVHYAVGEISAERQKGYSWFADWPDAALKDFQKWRAKLSVSQKPKGEK